MLKWNKISSNAPTNNAHTHIFIGCRLFLVCRFTTCTSMALNMHLNSLIAFCISSVVFVAFFSEFNLSEWISRCARFHSTQSHRETMAAMIYQQQNSTSISDNKNKRTSSIEYKMTNLAASEQANERTGEQTGERASEWESEWVSKRVKERRKEKKWFWN